MYGPIWKGPGCGNLVTMVNVQYGLIIYITELVEAMVTRRQSDETVAGFSNSSTKLICNLLSLLTWEIFAGSSVFGSHTNPTSRHGDYISYMGKFIMPLVLAFSSKYTLAAFQNLNLACS